MKEKKCQQCNQIFKCPPKTGISAWNKRKFCSMACRNKSYEKRTESNSFRWLGDSVGYAGLHKWVYRKKGKARKCEFCHKYSPRYEWANKSHEYRRDLEDWIELCASCHDRYDRHSINRKRDEIGRFI